MFFREHKNSKINVSFLFRFRDCANLVILCRETISNVSTLIYFLLNQEKQAEYDFPGHKTRKHPDAES